MPNIDDEATTFRKLTSISLTPLDMDRVMFLKGKCGLRSTTDVIRQALVEAVEARGGLQPLAQVVALAPAPPADPVETKTCRCGACGHKFKVPITTPDDDIVCPNPKCSVEGNDG